MTRNAEAEAAAKTDGDGPLSIGIVGHTGRFGAQVMAAALACGWAVVLRRNRRTEWLTGSSRVIFEAASAEATARTLGTATTLGVPVILATSGQTAEQEAEVRLAAQRIPVVLATNLSRGHHLQRRLVRDAVGWAGAGEVVVIDRHPVTKQDAPSASAKALSVDADGACIEVLRHGLPVADHRVVLTWPGESLEIIHRVTSLAPAVAGALSVIEAASHLTEAGLYRLDAGLRPMVD